MARTKASVGAKVASGKSSKARCVAAPTTTNTSSGSGERSKSSTGGGNPVCPRETPKWQRPISNFFISRERTSDDDGAGTSKSKPKRAIIASDDESPEKSKSKTDKPTEKETPEEYTNGDTNPENHIKTPEKPVQTPEKPIETSDEPPETPKKPPQTREKPKNNVLEESIELETLTGENSHKIDEYYPKNNKGKGVGKKTKGKENIRNKRSLDLIEDTNPPKKVKVS